MCLVTYRTAFEAKTKQPNSNFPEPGILFVCRAFPLASDKTTKIERTFFLLFA